MVGFAGRIVVCSVVVEVLVVRGSSEAQPESAPRAAALKHFLVVYSINSKVSDSRFERNGVYTPYPSIHRPRSVYQIGINHRNRTMTIIIEKYSRIVPLLVLTVVFVFFLGSGLGLAYLGGVFTGKNEVIANDKRLENLAFLKSGPSTTPGPAQR